VCGVGAFVGAAEAVVDVVVVHVGALVGSCNVALGALLLLLLVVGVGVDDKEGVGALVEVGANGVNVGAVDVVAFVVVGAGVLKCCFWGGALGELLVLAVGELVCTTLVGLGLGLALLVELLLLGLTVVVVVIVVGPCDAGLDGLPLPLPLLVVGVLVGTPPCLAVVGV